MVADGSAIHRLGTRTKSASSARADVQRIRGDYSHLPDAPMIAGDPTLATAHVILAEVDRGRESVRFRYRLGDTLEVVHVDGRLMMDSPARPPEPRDLGEAAAQISWRGGEIYCEHKGKRVGIGGEAAIYLRGTITV